jgi:predicted transcriptional regulator
MEIGPLEERVLDLLWRERGERSVRDVRDGLGGSLAYTTVMTTLDRLYKKGLLERRRSGRAYTYSPRTSREALAARRLRRWLARLLPGGAARPLLASFVDAVGEHDRALLPELERIVREKEREKRGRRP